MAEMCWFCKKNAGDEKSFFVHLYKIVGRKREMGGTFQMRTRVAFLYHTAKILIPRCSNCAAAHRKAERIENVTVFIGIILIGLSLVLITVLHSRLPLIGILSGVVLFVVTDSITKHYLQSLGVQDEKNMRVHPDILKLLAEGYKIGYMPTDVNE